MDCKYCCWWGSAHNGKLCFKCGKVADTATTLGRHVANDAVHNLFGLSYASYLVVPRAVLQHMPAGWQNRFVELMEEMNDMVDLPDGYAVNLRDSKGKFKRDPLSQYRRFPKERVQWKK